MYGRYSSECRREGGAGRKSSGGNEGWWGCNFRSLCPVRFVENTALSNPGPSLCRTRFLPRQDASGRADRDDITSQSRTGIFQVATSHHMAATISRM
jgi:hypothetical protein